MVWCLAELIQNLGTQQNVGGIPMYILQEDEKVEIPQSYIHMQDASELDCCVYVPLTVPEQLWAQGWYVARLVLDFTSPSLLFLELFDEESSIGKYDGQTDKEQTALYVVNDAEQITQRLVEYFDI